jgi:hypothetical protein
MTIFRHARSLFMAAILALAVPSPAAFAQAPPSPEALQVASELVSLTTKDLVDQVAQTMAAQVWPLVERTLNPKPDAPTLAKIKTEFGGITVDIVRDAMKDLPTIYARHFTIDELRSFVAFYRTPAGQKFIKTQPQLMQDTIALIQSKQGEINTLVMERLTPILREAQRQK